MRRIAFLLVAAAAAGASACSQNPEPAPPPPAPTVDSAAIRAREDSARMAREREEAERRAREDAERRAREAEAARVGLTSELTSMIHFDYDRADVRPDDAAILDRKAAILNANPTVRLRISGHADERGSDEYNLALGNRRAAAAKRYLNGRGIDDSRMDIVSFGEERPIQPGSDESAWAQNRRAEFEIPAGGANLVVPN